MVKSLNINFPAPDPDKQPLKANVYEAARQANTQLLPLFPYMGPGDIVTCCSSLESEGANSNVKVGYFVHNNSVDEVAMSYGSSGQMRTGEVWVGPREHGVGGDSEHAFFAVISVTQRQKEEGEQTEELAFKCEKCNEELFRYSFDESEGRGEFFASAPTIPGSFNAAANYNRSDENRICSACGHENPPFPLMVWGWGKYVRNTSIAEKARQALEEAVSK